MNPLTRTLFAIIMAGYLIQPGWCQTVEGFKSSGKMGTIENKELQNNIMDLYQENIPSLINSTNFYTSKKLILFEYVNMNRKRLTDSTTNLVSVLSSDPAYNICLTLTFVQEIVNRYDTCINKMNT